MKGIVEVIALTLIYSLESFFPLFPGRENRLRHGARNISLGLINVMMTAFLFSNLLALDTGWARERGIGFLYLFPLGPAAKGLVVFILLDLWMYLFHRANHQIPFLWRFHRTHHSDDQVDVTTALRFHTGEIVISSVFKLVLIPLIGINLSELLLYETCLQPVILFHHSNVALHEKWDRLMRILIVSPHMHRVHHSEVRSETDSNYSSIFSFWDRFVWTLRRREDPRTLQYGLPEFPEPAWQSLGGMLRTPLAPLRR